MSNKFKPVFNGFMKIYLHDDIPERLASRATFTEDWLPQSKLTGGKRHRIIKRERKFQVALHIFDTDGHKRGHNVMVFLSKGDQSALSKVIFGFGNDFVDEIREEHPDAKIDLVNSYAVVRA